MKIIRRLFVSALLLVCFAGSALAYMQTGSEALDFELADLEGNKVRLSDFKGQVIILQLGTTWCPDCVAQSHDLMKIGPRLNDQEVVLVKVYLQETRGRVRKFLQGKDFSVPTAALLDDGQVHRAYQVYMIPRLLIIDQQFRIAHDGLRLNSTALKEKIEALQP